MVRGKIGFCIALTLLFCSACEQRQSGVAAKDEKPLSSSQGRAGIMGKGSPATGSTARPGDQILRFPDPGRRAGRSGLRIPNQKRVMTRRRSTGFRVTLSQDIMRWFYTPGRGMSPRTFSTTRTRSSVTWAGTLILLQ